MNTTPRYNTITDTNVTNFFQHISPLNRPLTIRPNDNAYYFVRIQQLPLELQNISTATEEELDTNPVREISVTGWSVVDAEDGDLLKRDPGAAKELYFLLFLGLATRIGNTSQYAVSPVAINLLYDDNHGLFTTGATNDETVDEFEDYLHSIVLPAYYWRYHYVTKDLPADGYNTAMAARRMSRIRDLLNP